MKLEITEGQFVIETPMGLFRVNETNCGIALVFIATGDGERGYEVFSASRGPLGNNVFHGVDHLAATEHLLSKVPAKPPLWLDPALPLRVPAHAHGPRMGKAAKPIKGTISREEFVEAYAVYTREGGQQAVEQLLNGGGFSLVELGSALGHPPLSWIEDKLEEPVAPALREDKLEVGSLREGKLEDRATPVLLVAEYAGIVSRDKLEDEVPLPRGGRHALFKQCPTCGYGGDLAGTVYDCGRWGRDDIVTAHQHYRAYRESAVGFGLPMHKDKLAALKDKLEDPTTIATGVIPRDKLEGIKQSKLEE